MAGPPNTMSYSHQARGSSNHCGGPSRGVADGGRGGQQSSRGDGRFKPYERNGSRASPPTMPAFGQVVTVRTNCFKITKLPQDIVYQYKHFLPEVKTKDRRIKLFHKLQNVVAPHVFGRKVLFDSWDLAFSFGLLQLMNTSSGTAEFDVELNETDDPSASRSKTFKIFFELTAGAAINFKELNSQLLEPPTARSPNTQRAMSFNLIPATNILQLIIRQETDQKYPHNRHSFFMNDHSENRKLLHPSGSYRDTGLQLIRGFRQAVKPTLQGMIINVDMSMAAMYTPQNALDTAMEFLGLRSVNDLVLLQNDAKFQTLKKHLKNLRITVRFPAKTAKSTRMIRGLEFRGTNFEFRDKAGSLQTVKDYFSKTHSYKIKYPDIVSVVLSKEDAPIRVVVPLEVCDILPGQIYNKRIPNNLTADVVTFGTTRPQDRFNAITGHGQHYSHTPILGYSLSPYVVAAKMEISTIPMEVTGTILEPPKIAGGVTGSEKREMRTINVNNGAWNFNQCGFFDPKTMVPWCLVNFDSLQEQCLSKTARELPDRCKELGMHAAPPALHATKHFRSDVVKELDEELNRFQRTAQQAGSSALRPKLVVVILPPIADALRHGVKYWGDILRGIPTQCIRSDKVKTANSQYWANVAQKLNARLGGINASVKSSLPSVPLMIIGADVSHPAPGVQRPSYVGLAWSFDKTAARYEGDIRLQDPRVERIQALGAMVERAGRKFYHHHKVLPHSIVFFRDGLSDAEFENVGGAELHDMKESFKRLCDEINRDRATRNEKPVQVPRMTYIFVVKRHHLKFFPQNFRPSDVSDKKGNVHAGFVTSDKSIHHPRFMEFYLQAHHAIQGTARAARHLIYSDENMGYNYDTIEKLCFELCHVYSVASRSVSLPAPVYYADKICGRSQFHFNPNTDLGSDSGSASDMFDLAAYEQAFKPPAGSVSSTFYL